jgi:hypothetical protein
MNRHPGVLTADVEFRLMVPGGGAPLGIRTHLCYDPRDPYAVRARFATGTEGSVEWTFARDLLTEGLQRPSGEGDVRVWPAHGDLNVALSSPSGQALFEAPRDEVAAFLSRTYRAVPVGRESEVVDLDAELALILQ